MTKQLKQINIPPSLQLPSPTLSLETRERLKLLNQLERGGMMGTKHPSQLL